VFIPITDKEALAFFMANEELYLVFFGFSSLANQTTFFLHGQDS